MNQKHLDDRQLQDFLDGNIPDNDPVAMHLGACPRCQKALTSYRSLYLALEEDPGIALSPDFAETVMRRLPEKRRVEISPPVVSRLQIKDSMVMFIAAAAVIVAAIYFISPGLLIKPFASLPSPSLPESRILDNVNGLLSHVNISPLMIVFIIITFAGIGAADRIISHRRERQKPVSFLI